MLQELVAGFFFVVEHALLAGTRVDHNAEGERLVGFRSEVLDGLRLAVFKHGEVVFGKVGHEQAMLVLDIEEQVDDVDLRLEGGQVVLFFLGLRPRAGKRNQKEEERQGVDSGNTHNDGASLHLIVCRQQLTILVD